MTRLFVQLGLLVALLATAGGCGPSRAEVQAQRGVSAYFRGDYERAIELLQPLSHEPDGDYVLNNLRLGAAALAMGDLEQAERAYYRAYETLNAVGVNNPARTTATLLFDESIRIWLGEPYERAMANFDLGMVYYLRGDYGNARGAFENALFRLRAYADRRQERRQEYEEIESTFALAHLMLGRCWIHLGREDLADEHLQTAARLDRRLEPIASRELHEQTNVLLVIAWGTGPRKYAHGSQVSFGPPAPSFLPIPHVSVDGNAVASRNLAVPALDTDAMARQRRWQTVDTFRTIRDVAGTASIIGGVVVMDEGLRRGHGETVAIGAGLVGLGLLLDASARPDLRQWEMVPRTVYIMPMHLQPGTRDIRIRIPSPSGLGEGRHTFLNVPVPAQGEIALYTRLIPGVASQHDFAPPPQATPD